MISQKFIDRINHDATSHLHRVNAPLNDDELAEWQGRHSDVRLPEDLVSFLRLANGIALWTDADPRGYFSLLRLEDYGQPVRMAMYGDRASERLQRLWPDSLIRISDHLDGTQFVALNLATGEYVDADANAAPRTIGHGMEALLDWVWAHWVDEMREGLVGRA